MSQVAADLKMLIETANAPIFGIDAAGLVNEWNRKVHIAHTRVPLEPPQAEALTACVPFPLSVQAMEITGYPKEEVVGRSLVQV